MGSYGVLMVLINPISCEHEPGDSSTADTTGTDTNTRITTDAPLVRRSKIPAGAITSTLNSFFQCVPSANDSRFNGQSTKTVGLNTLLSRPHSRIHQATSITYTAETIPRRCTSPVPIFRYTARPTIIQPMVCTRCRWIMLRLTYLHSPSATNAVTISRNMPATIAGSNDQSATVRISPTATDVRRAFRFIPSLGSTIMIKAIYNPSLCLQYTTSISRIPMENLLIRRRLLLFRY